MSISRVYPGIAEYVRGYSEIMRTPTQLAHHALLIASYFKLRNKAFGPEIVDLGSLGGPLQPKNPLEQVGGASPPHLFQWVLRC